MRLPMSANCCGRSSIRVPTAHGRAEDLAGVDTRGKVAPEKRRQVRTSRTRTRRTRPTKTRGDESTSPSIPRYRADALETALECALKPHQWVPGRAARFRRGRACPCAGGLRSRYLAIVGTRVRDKMNDETIAEITASAIGTNRNPATPARKNIGTNTIQIQSSETNAGVTICAAPSRIAVSTSLPCSRC